jgi:hypothetical protein
MPNAISDSIRLDACYRAARAALPDVRLGGGMFSFFTELNRKRPPVDLLDFVTFTTVAIFHAGDDRSAMESLESLPYLAQSVKAFIGSKPYHVGPSSIGLRMNPYGEAPMANPHVFKGLAALAGQPLIDLVVSKPCEIQAIAAERAGGIELWIANLTSRMKTVELATELTGSAAVLTGSEFELSIRNISAMDSLEREFADKTAHARSIRRRSSEGIVIAPRQ